MQKHASLHKSIRSILLFLALIPMMLRPQYVTDGAKYGLLLWYQSVVPALFPFMVISGMIVASGGISLLMTPIYQLLCKVIPISKDGCYVLFSGLLCGYPMGAKTCADFVEEGRISLNEGKFLMAICNHPSPMFLLGYVYPFFRQTISVSKLLISVYTPVIFLSLLAIWIYFDENTGNSGIEVTEKNTRNQTTDESILSAVNILCKIGGYLVLFSIVIVFIRHMKVIPEALRMVLIGILEMTTGIRELSASLPQEPAWIASVATLTFGGCSGIFQTKAVLGIKKTAGLSIRPYIFWKLLHAVSSAGIAFLLCNI